MLIQILGLYNLLHPVRRILKLRCQSVKFDSDDFSFSFSRKAPKLNAYTDLDIYNNYLERHL